MAMSQEEFHLRVRSAAIAGWWALLIAIGWSILAALAWQGLVRARPDWLLTLWGVPDLTWPEVQRITFWFFAAFKLLLWLWALVMVWLGLWARRLARNG
jgi:hypothetical protein